MITFFFFLCAGGVRPKENDKLSPRIIARADPWVRTVPVNMILRPAFLCSLEPYTKGRCFQTKLSKVNVVDPPTPQHIWGRGGLFSTKLSPMYLKDSQPSVAPAIISPHLRGVNSLVLVMGPNHAGYRQGTNMILVSCPIDKAQ